MGSWAHFSQFVKGAKDIISCYRFLGREAGFRGTPLREEGKLQRLLEARVIERVLECGDPHHGFARIYCPTCRHDYLLAFSCRARQFCPSCHQKRVLACGDWVEENVLAPVPHRQYVFTVPKILRLAFSRRRSLLSGLCHIVERLLS